MKQKIIPIAATAILILAVFSIIRTQPVRAYDSPPAPPPRSNFTERVAAVGLIEASSENISIAAHLPGVVEKIWVRVGQEVKAGDPLVTLDTRALNATREQNKSEVAARKAALITAQARIKRNQAGLNEAKRNLRFAESVTDSRSISAEELSRRSSVVEIAEADLAAAQAEALAAEAAILSEEAALKAVEVELERSTVRAPIDGQILQLRIRPGEFAPAGPTQSPWMVLGNLSPLHLRVDIDEHEAWRVRTNASAVVQVRGNSKLQAEAAFVRFEPLVIPKQSLTGASTERVDTRVLQAIYKIGQTDLPLFVGQQMDVFIDASTIQTASVTP
jgi:multidrug resistance efflux pump